MRSPAFQSLIHSAIGQAACPERDHLRPIDLSRQGSQRGGLLPRVDSVRLVSPLRAHWIDWRVIGLLIGLCLSVEETLFIRSACADDKPAAAAQPAATQSGVVTPPAVVTPPDFRRQIQPILSEYCYHCHGPDAGHRKGDLRLDQLEDAFRDKVIVPGDPMASELIRRIETEDAEELMPPPASKRTLTAAQKKLLRDWVQAGAVARRHWAFVPPVRPALPDTPAGAIIRNPIDRFVAADLAAQGLHPAPQATPEKLLRRVTLDLTGLPPTPEELAEFLRDPSDAAYERAVDRLLQSSRYGERMVWDWLDAARYADTNGYQGDPTRSMWYWRDWAINAFNRNLPYDQFTIEQLAGDLLPNPSTEQLIATGFHRNHMINGEGGRIAEESRVEYVQDRVETTGTVWMGLTLTCCRCHNHKYDPFTQQEYYQLAAYFNSIEESGANDAGGLANPVFSFPTPEQARQIEQLKAREAERQQQLAAIETRAREELPAREKQLIKADGQWAAPAWKELRPSEHRSQSGTTFELQPDGSLLTGETSPATDEYLLTYPVDLNRLTGLKLEVLPDDRLPHRGPGRAPENGNFVLNELQVSLRTVPPEGSSTPAAERPVRLSFVQASYSQGGWDAAGAVDGKPETGWAVASESGKPQTLILDLNAADNASPGMSQALIIKMQFRFGGQHTLGRFRVSVTGDDPLLLRSPSEAIQKLLAKPIDQRTDAERNELAKLFLDSSPSVIAARQLRDAARQEREAVERSAPRTMVMRERAQPRDTFVLVKGAYNQFGEKVNHGVLKELAPLPADAAPNRLALARWLVSKEHPLTARVSVNRFWQQLFGIGLVKSSEDFGVQGDPPSHPELLDWLAVEFRDSGWNVKQLLKLIVTSHAYRQSSRVTPELFERDPENRLLARGPRYRLPSWMIRDQALAVSGLLNEKIGGPPVKGYQPPGIWEEATFGQIRYQQDHGDALYRRSVYLFWRRIVAPTMFFDTANRQNCSVKASRTNTPLQALVTLNDITYVEAARALAQRTLLSTTAQTDEARLQELFRRATCRELKPAEQSRLLKRLTDLRAHFQADQDAAQKILKVGESPADPKLPAGELAAWTGICSLVLNLDELLCQE